MFEKSATRNALLCSSYSLQGWIVYGVFYVKIDTEERILKPGDFFKVPICEAYSLKNLRNHDKGLISYRLLYP